MAAHDEDRPPVVLFTQAGCADSARVRRWLTDRGVSFGERNVTGDDDAARALLATGHFGTPLAVVGETAIVGFQPGALAAALGQTGG